MSSAPLFAWDGPWVSKKTKRKSKPGCPRGSRRSVGHLTQHGKSILKSEKGLWCSQVICTWPGDMGGLSHWQRILLFISKCGIENTISPKNEALFTIIFMLICSQKWLKPDRLNSCPGWMPWVSPPFWGLSDKNIWSQQQVFRGYSCDELFVSFWNFHDFF